MKEEAPLGKPFFRGTKGWSGGQPMWPFVTPWFREDETEASIRVPRMFKSHIQ
jgi:hypothetical protein